MCKSVHACVWTECMSMLMCWCVCEVLNCAHFPVYVCAHVCVSACVVCMLSALWGAVMVVEEEGWRETAGPAGGCRCGATELTVLGPSGRMCANHNLSRSAAAPSAVWLWCTDREQREREALWFMKI